MPTIKHSFVNVVLPLLLATTAVDAFSTPCSSTAVAVTVSSPCHQQRHNYHQCSTLSTALFMGTTNGDGKDKDIGATIKDAFANLDTTLDIDIDMTVIQSNVMEGKVGERGEAWTAAWVLLTSFILLGGIPIPFLNNLLTFLGGPGLMVGGIAVILTSLNDLGGTNLTPFLTPVSKGSLITDGIFGSIRHPIYAGVIALAAGFSILTGSAARLVITALLIFVLDVKSNKEEDFLVGAYPDYAAYKAKVTGKFLPGDWSSLLQQKED